MDKWDILGFSILNLQHQILNLLPDFTANQRQQLLALSNETKKEERFHNDAILSRRGTMTEDEYLEKLKSYEYMIKDALIIKDKTLKILLNPVSATLGQTATFLLREIDSHGINLTKMILYDAADAKIVEDISEIAIFEKTL